MRYVAYGSNMLTRRLTAPSRAPSARACGVARLSGWVVRFHKRGVDGSGKWTLVRGAADAATYVWCSSSTHATWRGWTRPRGWPHGGAPVRLSARPEPSRPSSYN